MKRLLLISIFIILAACGSKKDETIVLNNYAAVWELDTEDYDFFVNLLPEQSEALIDYYNKGLVENVYLQQGEDTGETYSVGSISFIVRAKDEEGAKAILDGMPFSKSNIATYELYPLGVKWLKRTGTHNKVFTESKQTYVVIWISTASKEEMAQHVKVQVAETLSLYEDGIVENAYLSPDIISGSKQGYPIIYFINAKDVASAKAILDNTVYPRLGMAKYELRPVGNFWLGSKNDEVK